MSDDGLDLFFEEALEHWQSEVTNLFEGHLSEVFVCATLARSCVDALESILT